MILPQKRAESQPKGVFHSGYFKGSFCGNLEKLKSRKQQLGFISFRAMAGSPSIACRLVEGMQ